MSTLRLALISCVFVVGSLSSGLYAQQQPPGPVPADPATPSPELEQIFEGLRGGERIDRLIESVEAIRLQITQIEGRLAKQEQTVQQLSENVQELNARLSEVPAMSLKGVASSQERGSLAYLQVDDDLRLVREGDTIQLRPVTPNSVARSLAIREIRDGRAVVELGPWGHVLVVD